MSDKWHLIQKMATKREMSDVWPRWVLRPQPVILDWTRKGAYFGFIFNILSILLGEMIYVYPVPLLLQSCSSCELPALVLTTLICGLSASARWLYLQKQTLLTLLPVISYKVKTVSTLSALKSSFQYYTYQSGWKSFSVCIFYHYGVPRFYWKW